MAKYRTKKNRVRAKERRATQLQTLNSANVLPSASQNVSRRETIFSYDHKLIAKDLKKTFLLVIFILLVLLSIALIYT